MSKLVEEPSMAEHNDASDPYALRKKLAFEQAEGVKPLPTQLQLKEVSPALRAAVWDLIYKEMQRDAYSESNTFETYIGGNWRAILEYRHTNLLHRPTDEFDSRWETVVNEIKNLIMRGDYAQFFGFLQYVMRHPECPRLFSKRVDGALKFAHAAYRVIDRTTIVPVGSDAERKTIERAFTDLASAEFHGARQHLRTAAEQLAVGHVSDSIRESIHAVESAVRVLEQDANFSKALAKLDAKVKINGALKAGFNRLYGFTNDEKGLRHALLDAPAANVDEVDALFMIGACAAFVSYLINKSRNAGLLNKPRNRDH
jgi:hypothetical protein